MIRIKFLAAPGELNESDSHTLRVLQQQCFGEVYAKIENMQQYYWWVAYDGRSQVGFCALEIAEEPDTAILSLCGVVPGYRGQGLQRRMIKVREKLARTLPEVKRIVSYVANYNIVSANNLIKCKYFLYDPETPWGVATAYYFEKIISR